MAYTTTDYSLPSRASPPYRLSRVLAILAERVATPLRKRWVYHQTLLELQGYTERNLLDLGATEGVEAFARRAAGLEDAVPTAALSASWSTTRAGG